MTPPFRKSPDRSVFPSSSILLRPAFRYQALHRHLLVLQKERREGNAKQLCGLEEELPRPQGARREKTFKCTTSRYANDQLTLGIIFHNLNECLTDASGAEMP
ncbi:uncharacterized protein LOC120706532 isoform X2 [Panicum virgatum]|uniref:uncharacterized protein LOC120706532 isoform X2 n=1 Tax=Panicum virgatum TaxID=38727 RepID=UPI0019D52E9B|nr:uncharacterized protein LOC120706532 isoform X2 [Panicum virgatum]